MDGDALRIVQSWVYPHEGVESSKSIEPKTIPWAGERVTQLHSALDAACSPDGGEWLVNRLQAGWHAFDSLRKDFSLVSRQGKFNEQPEAEDVEVLARHWNEISSTERVNGGMHSKLRRYVSVGSQLLALILTAADQNRAIHVTFACG